MADTQRTKSAALALITDNTTGDISYQDLRDLATTWAPGHAEIYVSSASATTVTTAATWYEATDGTFTLSSHNVNWAETANGRLYYTGTATRVCHVAMSYSVTSASNNQVVWLGVGLDGTILTPSIVKRKIGTGTDIGTGAAHAFTAINNGSYLAPMIYNSTSTANVTLDTCNLFVMDMPHG